MDIHKEKVARREIGSLASSKNITRTQKVVTPSLKERPQKYVRNKIDFSSLDHVGHGVRSSVSEGRKYSSTPVDAHVRLCYVKYYVQSMIPLYILKISDVSMNFLVKIIICILLTALWMP